MPAAAVATKAPTVRKRKNAALWAALSAIHQYWNRHVECDEYRAAIRTQMPTRDSVEALAPADSVNCKVTTSNITHLPLNPVNVRSDGAEYLVDDNIVHELFQLQHKYAGAKVRMEPPM